MKIEYYLMGLDEDRAPMVEVPLTSQQAGELILNAIAAGQIKAEVPAVEIAEDEAEQLPARKKKTATGKRKKKGQKVCKVCGEPGHIAKTCTKNTASHGLSSEARKELEDSSALSPEVKERIRDMRDQDMTTTEIAKEFAAELDMDFDALKSEVAKVMSREARKRFDGTEQRKVLSQEEYDAVRSATHESDFSSAQYALSHMLSPKEVNAAIESPDYETYRAGL